MDSPRQNMTVRLARRVALFLLLLLLVARAWGQAERLPEPRGRVNDFAEVIDPAPEERIGNLIREVETRVGAEFAVVTIRSLHGEPIEDYAERLFQKWGIGKKERDNGLLLLAAIEDRRVRIEVG